MTGLKLEESIRIPAGYVRMSWRSVWVDLVKVILQN